MKHIKMFENFKNGKSVNEKKVENFVNDDDYADLKTAQENKYMNINTIKRFQNVSLLIEELGLKGFEVNLLNYSDFEVAIQVVSEYENKNIVESIAKKFKFKLQDIVMTKNGGSIVIVN